jgi:hypothetical protein
MTLIGVEKKFESILALRPNKQAELKLSLDLEMVLNEAKIPDSMGMEPKFQTKVLTSTHQRTNNTIKKTL